jgi:hypothetical protein
MIDKQNGYKAIGKMVNGEFTIIKKITDGGILLNDWHQIIITAKTGNIKVYMYDEEISTKVSSEKTIEVNDSTFVKGGVAVFVNGVNGFFFDKLVIDPINCWSPWEPKSDLSIMNPNSNIYYEDFFGILEERYTIIDTEEVNQKEGPSSWGIVYEDVSLGSYIHQDSMISDSSSRKQSSFLILKEKNFCHGKIFLEFRAQNENGIISTIIKYSDILSVNGQKKTQYLSFDMNNENEPTFSLRYWNNGDVKVINSINASQIKGFEKAYVKNKQNNVKIEYINGRITIYASQNGGEFQQIINTKHEIIKCGSVGFGTFNTPAKFSLFEITPMNMKLSLNDIDYIINNTTPYIPVPSVEQIASIADNIPQIKSTVNFGLTASDYLLTQSSMLQSTMGKDFSKNILDQSYISINLEGKELIKSSTTDSQIEINMRNRNSNNSIKDGGWKTCVVTRSNSERKKYCQSNYNNPVFQNKCEKNFCTECCEAQIDPIYNNIIHVCKKTCYKSTLASTNNDEYKNVCINSPNTNSNIYGYCESMAIFNQVQKESCKLDMCNLCCVTMDAIKTKIYSVNSLRRCYDECNKSKLFSKLFLK